MDTVDGHWGNHLNEFVSNNGGWIPDAGNLFIFLGLTCNLLPISPQCAPPLDAVSDYWGEGGHGYLMLAIYLFILG